VFPVFFFFNNQYNSILDKVNENYFQLIIASVPSSYRSDASYKNMYWCIKIKLACSEADNFLLLGWGLYCSGDGRHSGQGFKALHSARDKIRHRKYP